MIKFFRKIRKKMLVENRFNKYLFYAVGEIVLVVIGILIALQINNWNEKKNQQKTVKALFLEVQKDLLNDIEEATFVIDWYEELDTLAQNIYNNKFTKQDYINAKGTPIYNPGITFFPLQLSNQTFKALNTKKELISEEYADLLKNLNSLYNEQAEFLEQRQSEATKQAIEYYNYLHAKYDWIIDFKNKNYTDEIIDYYLNNKYHKRQVMLWNDYTNRAYVIVARIKNDAIINSFIIHKLFTPEKELPEALKKLSFNFKINNKQEYLGFYKAINSNEEGKMYEIYSKYNLLFWNSKNDTKIYGDGLPLVELGKDSLGFANTKNYPMVFNRNEKGDVVGISGYNYNKKIIEFIRTEND